MRILLVGDYPPDARLGSTKVLLKLREEFTSLGHTCDVLLSNDLGQWPNNSYLRQAVGPLLAHSAVSRMFRRNGPYDVVDIASAEGLWVALRRSGVMNGAVVISRSNGLEHLNYQRMLDDHAAGLVHKPWTRRLFHPAVRLTQVAAAARAADRLLLLNESDRDYALEHRWKGASDIDVVAHGVSHRFLADAPDGHETRGAGILYCGSWTHVKGVVYLVEAFTLLARSRSSVRLTVMGGGVPGHEILAAFPADVRDRVVVVDRSSEDHVMDAYRRHDVLAWPSTYEGFGMVLLEAMTQRLPVVATPVGCARTLVASDRTGILVPRRDAPSLARALGRMLDDRAFSAQCAAAAFARVRPLTWTRTALSTLAVYARAAGDRRDGRVH
jgi:glycosyltransferase involved in cell wall biosynthesis